MGNYQTFWPDVGKGALWGGAIAGAAPAVGNTAQWLWDGAKWVKNLAGSKGLLPKTSYQTSDMVEANTPGLSPDMSWNNGQPTSNGDMTWQEYMDNRKTLSALNAPKVTLNPEGNATVMAPNGVIRATPQQFNAAGGKIDNASATSTDTTVTDANGNTTVGSHALGQRNLDSALGPTASSPSVPGYNRTLAQQVEADAADRGQPPDLSSSPGISHLQQSYANSEKYGPRFAAIQQRQDQRLANTVQHPNADIAGADQYAPGEEFTRQLDQMHADALQGAEENRLDVGRNLEALGTPTSATEAGTVMKGAIDAQHAPAQNAANQAVNDAQTARDQALAATPPGRPPIPGGQTSAEQHGAGAVASAVIGQQASGANLDVLKAAVGNPTHDVTGIKTTVAHMYDSMPGTAAAPAGEEAKIAATIKGLPDAMPLQDTLALRDRVNDEIARQTQAAGTTSTTEISRLMGMKSAIDESIHAPITAQSDAEAAAVKAGTMRPEDTLAAKLQAWRTAAQQHAQTYRSGVVGDLLGTGDHASGAQNLTDIPRARGSFAQPDSDAMAKVWNGKESEAQNVRNAIAGGITPEQHISYLADDLRKVAVDADGNFDRQAFREWAGKH
jgi:hypothetical protein